MLSADLFETEDIRLAETALMRALDWMLHPPTAPSYVHLLLRYVEDEGQRAELARLADFFLERALPDLWFVRWRFSTVALASILCAFHRGSRHCTANISAGVLEQWMQSVQTELVDCGIQVDDSCMMCARRMLLLDTEVRDLQTSSKCRKRRSMPDHTFDATHVRANAMETKDDDRAAAADDDGAAE